MRSGCLTDKYKITFCFIYKIQLKMSNKRNWMEDNSNCTIYTEILGYVTQYLATSENKLLWQQDWSRGSWSVVRMGKCFTAFQEY